MATLSSEALRAAGLDALRRELGVSGMVRFLQQFENGNGDYTAERWQWLPAEASVADLVTVLRQETVEHEPPVD